MTARDLMEIFDRRLFGSRIAGDVLRFGSHELTGKFTAGPREITLANGGFRSVVYTFDCRYDAAIAELAENEEVTVVGVGTFRFLCELLPGGDESGLTIIELGSRS